MPDLARGWQVRCPKCGQTFDAADLGIIRIGAVGNSRILRKCGMCRRIRWLIIEPKPVDIPEAAGPRCDLATHDLNAANAAAVRRPASR